ncbi:MAG TPA: hypothetical protein VE088_03135 [Gaiellaceae bacterium]|jgi:hypothetical protein|nr:hypothetical protein [Gaiellaceae bacterium]
MTLTLPRTSTLDAPDRPRSTACVLLISVGAAYVEYHGDTYFEPAVAPARVEEAS